MARGAFVVGATYAHHMDHGDGIPRDANGYAYADGVTTRTKLQQRVLNEAWPQKDDKGFHARDVPEQPPGNHRPCLVRLELANDGEIVLPGRASRWTRSHVYVIVDDFRVPNQAVWVRAHDVRRR